MSAWEGSRSVRDFRNEHPCPDASTTFLFMVRSTRSELWRPVGLRFWRQFRVSRSAPRKTPAFPQAERSWCGPTVTLVSKPRRGIPKRHARWTTCWKRCLHRRPESLSPIALATRQADLARSRPRRTTARTAPETSRTSAGASPVGTAPLTRFGPIHGSRASGGLGWKRASH